LNESLYQELQARLGYTFKNPALLQTALTHPSIRHEATQPVEHNQRLEFLGDSVLELVLTAEIYQKFPQAGEGILTRARAQLVNRKALAEHGRRLGLGQCLILSKGDEKHGGRERESSLADAFEAVVGAVFMDGGYETARDVILRLFHQKFGELNSLPLLENPKGELQELLQAQSTAPPAYRVFSTTGPDHDREFECAVFHHGIELGRGRGKSKKEAEAAAAREALKTLRQQQTIESQGENPQNSGA